MTNVLYCVIHIRMICGKLRLGLFSNPVILQDEGTPVTMQSPPPDTVMQTFENALPSAQQLANGTGWVISFF